MFALWFLGNRWATELRIEELMNSKTHVKIGGKSLSEHKNSTIRNGAL